MGIEHNEMTEEERRRWELKTREIMHQEIDDVFTIRAETEMLTDEQIEIKKLKQKTRLEQMKKLGTVQTPEFIPKEKVYAKKPKNAFLTSSKRQKEMNKGVTTVLGRKETDARLLNAHENGLGRRIDRFDELMFQATGKKNQTFFYFTQQEKTALSGFFHRNDSDLTMMAEYSYGGDRQMKVVESCMKEFMSINLSDYDVTSDDALVLEAPQLIKLRDQVNSIRELLELNPDYWDKVDPDAKQLFDEQYERASALAKYFTAKELLLTDPYYISHHNSEIPYTYKESDPPEVRALCHKIMMVEALEKDLYESQKGIRTTPVENAEPELTQKLHNTMPKTISTEFGKNEHSSNATRHMDYMRIILEGRHPEKVKRLIGEKYRVTGEDVACKEEFTRHLYCLANLKACHSYPQGLFRRMIDNLTATPEDPENEAQVLEARGKNLHGLKAFMGLIKSQVDYLDRKYGQSVSILKYEDVGAHYEELQCDFADQAEFSYVLDYCSRFGQLWTSDFEKIRQKYRYYEVAAMAFGAGANYFASDETKSVAEGRAFGAEFLGRWKEGAKPALRMRNERIDVDWTATFSGGAPYMLELMQFITTPKTLEILLDNYRKSHKKGQKPHWYDLDPRLEEHGKTPKEIVEFMIQSELNPQKAAMRRDWREHGVHSLAADLPGIGTEDQAVTSEFYEKLFKNPALLEQHGVTDKKEKMRFVQIMENWHDAGEKIREQEYISSLCLEVKTAFKDRQMGEEASAIINEMREAFIDRADEAYMQMNELFGTIGKEAYRDLQKFMCDHKIFIFEEHEKYFNEVISPEMEAVPLDQEVKIGGKTFKTCASNEYTQSYSLGELFGGKELKDENDAPKLEKLVNEYNGFMKQFLVHINIESPVKGEEDWDTAAYYKDIKHKKAFFSFCMTNRRSFIGDYLEVLGGEIRRLLK